MQKFTLKESKGVVLPVLILLMKVNRPVSVTYLVDEIDSSDKTICKALRFLQKKEAVTQIGRLYQYCGDEYQLPLYWGERIEPADPSPASYQAELPGIGIQAEKFSGKIPESGKFPVPSKRSTNDIIQDHEARIRALEAELAALKSGEIPERIEQKTSTFVQNSIENSEKFPKTGEIPTKSGEFSDVNFKTTTTINESINNQEKLIVVEEKNPESGKIPDSEKIPENLTDEEIEDRFEINRNAALEYWRQKDSYELDYKAPEYKKEEYEEFLDLDGDPEIFEFILPRAASPDVVKKWLGLSRKQAKEKLARLFGFWGEGLGELINRDDIHLQNIDYAYWDWRKNEKDKPNIKIGIVLMRILNHYDELSAKNSAPLEYKYLEV